MALVGRPFTDFPLITAVNPTDLVLVFHGTYMARVSAQTLVNCTNRTGTAVVFDRDAEYNPISTGTFTVNNTGMVIGAVVCIYLTPTATAPTIPTTGYKLITGIYTASNNLMYMFKVGANAQIQYTITNLDL